MSIHEPPICACCAELFSPHERRLDKCIECERMDERMYCVVCLKWVGMAYTDGSPTLCSIECERRWHDAR